MIGMMLSGTEVIGTIPVDEQEATPPQRLSI